MKVEFEINVRRVLMPAIGGVMGLFVLHAAYPALYRFWPEDSAQMAAWVQALVSAVAIAAGAAAIYWQVSRQAQLEAERGRIETVRKLQALNHAAFRLRLELVILRSNVRKGFGFESQLPYVARVAKLLGDVPLMDVPTYDASHAVFNCATAVAVLSSALADPGGIVTDDALRSFQLKQIRIALGFVVDAEAILLKSLGEFGARGMDVSWDYEGTSYVNGVTPR